MKDIAGKLWYLHQDCEVEYFIRQYEQDRNVLRFHFHKPKELLSRLKDLQLPKRDLSRNQISAMSRNSL